MDFFLAMLRICKRFHSSVLLAICVSSIAMGIFIIKDNHDHFHFREISWDDVTYKVEIKREGYVYLTFTRVGRKLPELELGGEVINPYFLVYDLDQDGYDEVFYHLYSRRGFIDYSRESDSLEFVKLESSSRHRHRVAPGTRELRFQDLSASCIYSSLVALVLIFSGLFTGSVGCFKLYSLYRSVE